MRNRGKRIQKLEEEIERCENAILDDGKQYDMGELLLSKLNALKADREKRIADAKEKLAALQAEDAPYASSQPRQSITPLALLVFAGLAAVLVIILVVFWVSQSDSTELNLTSMPTDTPTQFVAVQAADTPTDTPRLAPTMQDTATPTETLPPTATDIPSNTPTHTDMPTETPSVPPTDTSTDTPTPTETPSPTATPVPAPTVLIGPENIVSAGEYTVAGERFTIPSAFYIDAVYQRDLFRDFLAANALAATIPIPYELAERFCSWRTMRLPSRQELAAALSCGFVDIQAPWFWVANEPTRYFRVTPEGEVFSYNMMPVPTNTFAQPLVRCVRTP